MKFVYFIIAIFLCTACSDDSDTEELSVSPFKVDILFSPSGLGDSGYNDIMLKGIIQSCIDKGFTLEMHSPKTLSDGWNSFEEWKQDSTSNQKRLFIFASNGYESLLSQTNVSADKNKSILLLETDNHIDNVCTFRLETYGAAYYIGCLVANTFNSAALLIANPSDNNLKGCIQGFEDGFYSDLYPSESEKLFGKYYLAEKAEEGYNMPDSAYRMSYKLYQDYSFVFPIAGGSNSGVFRYTREYPMSIYTAGIDADMSVYSTQIIASIVKRLDLVIDEYISRWMAGDNIIGQTTFGLESNYVYVSIAKNYEEFYEPITSGLIEISKEKEYEYVEQN